MAVNYISLITIAIMIPISALVLMISTKLFKLKDSSYKTAILIALILGVANAIVSLIGDFVPSIAVYIGLISLVLVSILLAIYLVKSKYNLEWGKAILVWLVWLVINLIVAFIVAMILAAIFVAVGIVSLAA